MWKEIDPEHVPDQETVSFRFRVTGTSILEARSRALDTGTDVHLGVGAMVGEVKKSPGWWNNVLLTRANHRYDLGAADELVATGLIGPRSYSFNDPGAQIWVMLDFQWTPAGSFVELTEDPRWTEGEPMLAWRRNSPPETVPDALTHDPWIVPIQRVWLRENPRELWSSGTYGWGNHLHSFVVEESPDAVRLTCRVGTTDEYRLAVQRAEESGVQMARPAIAHVWAVRSLLVAPLGGRQVYFRADGVAL